MNDVDFMEVIDLIKVMQVERDANPNVTGRFNARIEKLISDLYCKYTDATTDGDEYGGDYDDDDDDDNLSNHDEYRFTTEQLMEARKAAEEYKEQQKELAKQITEENRLLREQQLAGVPLVKIIAPDEPKDSEEAA